MAQWLGDPFGGPSGGMERHPRGVARLYAAKSDILKPGGSKGLIASKLDTHFTKLGWKEKKFDTKIVVDSHEH